MQGAKIKQEIKIDKRKKADCCWGHPGPLQQSAFLFAAVPKLLEHILKDLVPVYGNQAADQMPPGVKGITVLLRDDRRGAGLAFRPVRVYQIADGAHIPNRL